MPNSISQRIKLAARILLSKETAALKGSANQVFAAGAKARQVPGITQEEVAEARQFFPMDKFFIFGHARSGTTMLARLIRLHPEVHCNHQAHFFTRPPLLESLVRDEEVGAWLKRGSNRWNHGKDLSPVVLRAAADFIMEREARREGKRIVGDKSPNSLNDGESVRLMHKVYPDGYLIYIVRDGRDTVISHRFQAFIEFPERLSPEDQQIRRDFASDPEPFLHGGRSIFTEKAIQRAAEGWVRNMTETDQNGKELYGDHYYAIRYESLLEKPFEEMTRLWTFLGASPASPGLQEALVKEMQQNPDADWQQQKAKDIAQAIQKGQQGSWREVLTARDKKIFHQVAADTLKAWGYEVE